MQVAPESLHERFEGLPSEELRAILAARAGEYTPEALAIATAVLARRPTEPTTTSAELEEPSAKQGLVLAILGAVAVSSSHLSSILVRAWREWEQDPDALLGAFAAVVSSPWTYVVAGVGALWLWRRSA